MITVFIEPHERWEAIDAYRDRLSADQIEQIEEAPETAVVQLNLGPNLVAVHIIEGG